MSFEEMWAELLPVGRDAATGGYHRFAWTPPELECRAWFADEARRRGLGLEHDPNGNMVAWWYPEDGTRTGAVLTGSHLDSVPGGGAFDGPLGIVSAFAAVDLLRERGVRPARPIGIGAFAEEEGARFGVACLGSRLLAGAIDPARARGLTDADGHTFAEVVHNAGLDPHAIGPDEDLLGRIACYVELHVEQGRALEEPVGVASAIVPHGRWRFDFAGEGNHAGTTGLPDRRDPMLPFAHMVIAAREAAERNGTVATVGKVRVEPNGVNAIPSAVTAWLDARGPADDAVRRTVLEVDEAARIAARPHRVSVDLAEESYTEIVDFNLALRDRVRSVLGGVPVLPTGAGHDAGVLSARLPAAMLFVRNPTGVSHAPEEFAEPADRLAGVEALAAVLDDLARG
ncbi:N-carbamoyl-L-amino-acid hydrolase [Actinomadura coerulea]|uniref:N-carbamoyl-L-amino-acid hydrolase n=1 Tax=Actinomadura coerulea TaxID=46159 RepID=A0A7X0G753_9ACTN|nr:allantoate amidohydrolase [Actinomadura coerulea]MBB6400703.1 N-carbamoyl-L-amino-acid hydrolase [Actinomadura coerulea]GGQ09164.1 Zn-dependent hydrolase [Actinomadura coerulea]